MCGSLTFLMHKLHNTVLQRLDFGCIDFFQVFISCICFCNIFSYGTLSISGLGACPLTVAASLVVHRQGVVNTLSPFVVNIWASRKAD